MNTDIILAAFILGGLIKLFVAFRDKPAKFWFDVFRCRNCDKVHFHSDLHCHHVHFDLAGAKQLDKILSIKEVVPEITEDKQDSPVETPFTTFNDDGPITAQQVRNAINFYCPDEVKPGDHSLDTFVARFLRDNVTLFTDKTFREMLKTYAPQVIPKIALKKVRSRAEFARMCLRLHNEEILRLNSPVLTVADLKKRIQNHIPKGNRDVGESSDAELQLLLSDLHKGGVERSRDLMFLLQNQLKNAIWIDQEYAKSHGNDGKKFYFNAEGILRMCLKFKLEKEARNKLPEPDNYMDGEAQWRSTIDPPIGNEWQKMQVAREKMQAGIEAHINAHPERRALYAKNVLTEAELRAYETNRSLEYGDEQDY